MIQQVLDTDQRVIYPCRLDISPLRDDTRQLVISLLLGCAQTVEGSLTPAFVMQPAAVEAPDKDKGSLSS